jgi:hypothetical protein
LAPLGIGEWLIKTNALILKFIFYSFIASHIDTNGNWVGKILWQTGEKT